MGFLSNLGAIVSLGTKVAGVAMTAKGQKDQGAATQASLAYRSAVLRNNAELADRAAADALARGREEAAQIGIGARGTVGRQRVALASNGVVVDQGSALDIVADTALLSRLDIEQSQINSAREAMGFTATGENFRKEAALLDQTGASVGKATKLNVLSTFVGGAGDVASKWYNFHEQGIL